MLQGSFNAPVNLACEMGAFTATDKNAAGLASYAGTKKFTPPSVEIAISRPASVDTRVSVIGIGAPLALAVDTLPAGTVPDIQVLELEKFTV